MSRTPGKSLLQNLLLVLLQTVKVIKTQESRLSCGEQNEFELGNTLAPWPVARGLPALHGEADVRGSPDQEIMDAEDWGGWQWTRDNRDRQREGDQDRDRFCDKKPGSRPGSTGPSHGGAHGSEWMQGAWGHSVMWLPDASLPMRPRGWTTSWFLPSSK